MNEVLEVQRTQEDLLKHLMKNKKLKEKESHLSKSLPQVELQNKIAIYFDNEATHREVFEEQFSSAFSGKLTTYHPDSYLNHEIDFQEIDIIISDKRMSVIDGLDLLLKIKRSFPKKVFVLYSGWAIRETDVLEKIRMNGILRFNKRDRSLFIESLYVHMNKVERIDGRNFKSVTPGKYDIKKLEKHVEPLTFREVSNEQYAVGIKKLCENLLNDISKLQPESEYHFSSNQSMTIKELLVHCNKPTHIGLKFMLEWLHTMIRINDIENK